MKHSQFTIRDIFGWTFLVAVACALLHRPIRACWNQDFVRAVGLPFQFPLWIVGYDIDWFVPSSNPWAECVGFIVGVVLLWTSAFVAVIFVYAIFLAITGRYK